MLPEDQATSLMSGLQSIMRGVWKLSLHTNQQIKSWKTETNNSFQI